jgi:SAM-dependent methyltransferase
MNLDFEEKYHQLEQTHWWFKKRRELVVSWVRKHRKDSAILDIGCSSGALLTDLNEVGYNNVSGIDVSETAVALAQQNGHDKASVMDGASTTFPAAQFDILVASDCLEHIENDETALADWMRILKPGGTLILFVPAYQFLWSAHDEVNHHFRRYTGKLLRTRVRNAGFTIARKGFWNFFLFPAISAVRLAQRMLPKSKKPVDDLKQPGPFTNKVLSAVIQVENSLLQGMNLPVGISTYVVAKKPD